MHKIEYCFIKGRQGESIWELGINFGKLHLSRYLIAPLEDIPVELLDKLFPDLLTLKNIDNAINQIKEAGCDPHYPLDESIRYHSRFNPHPASKVIEVGYFCLGCNKQVRYKDHHICREFNHSQRRDK